MDLTKTLPLVCSSAQTQPAGLWLQVEGTLHLGPHTDNELNHVTALKPMKEMISQVLLDFACTQHVVVFLLSYIQHSL